MKTLESKLFLKQSEEIQLNSLYAITVRSLYKI